MHPMGKGFAFRRCLLLFGGLFLSAGVHAQYKGENVLVRIPRPPSNSCSFPSSLDVTVKRDDHHSDVIMFLTTSTTGESQTVTLMRTDDVIEDIGPEHLENSGAQRSYHNQEHKANFLVWCSEDKDTQSSFFTLEGTFILEHATYELSPTLYDDVIIGADDVTAPYVMNVVSHPRYVASSSDGEMRTSHLGASRTKRSNGSHKHRRTKRGIVPNHKDWFVDIQPVVDYKTFSRWKAYIGDDDDAVVKQVILSYLGRLFISVNLKLQTLDLSSGIILHIRPLDTIIHTDAASSPFAEDNKATLADGVEVVDNEALTISVLEWVSNNQGAVIKHYPMVFIGYPVRNTGTDDIVYSGAMGDDLCESNSFSMIADSTMGQSTELLVAQAIGFSLGADCDGDVNSCDSSDHYIMSDDVSGLPDQKVLVNRFQFSTCSDIDVDEYISDKKRECLNPVFNRADLLQSSPGTGIGIEEQCQRIFGSTSKLCGDKTVWDDFCLIVYCMDEDGKCQHMLPAIGTCCSDGKYCVEGVCTDAPEGECVDAKLTVNRHSIVNNQNFNTALGQSLDVQCSVVGGYPPPSGYPSVSSVTINCDDVHNMTDDGASTRMSFNADEIMDGKRCTCSGQHVSGNYTLKTSFTVEITPEPPSSPPQLRVNGQSIVNNQNLDTTLGQSLDVGCRVVGGYPSVSNVTINCDDVHNITDVGALTKMSFNADEMMDGKQCTCSGQHVSGNYTLTTSFIVDITPVPPPNPPVVTVNKMSIVDDQVLDVAFGEVLDVHCSVDGGYPGVSNVTIHCDGMPSIDNTGTSGTKSLNADETVDGKQCTCSGVHESGNYDKTTTFTVAITPEPPSSPPQLRVNRHSIVNNQNLDTTLGQSLDVGCSVVGGYPSVSSVTINCDDVHNMTDAGTSTRMFFNADDIMDGKQCTCSGQHVSGNYTLTTFFTVDITPVPPPNQPVVTVNKMSIVDDQVLDVAFGEVLDVHCSVDGGYPGVSNVTIHCDGMPSTANTGTSGTKSLNADETVDGKQCTCSGVHVSGNYDKTTTFTVAITPEPPSSPPQLTVNRHSIVNNQNFNTALGQSLDVQCSVVGGYPSVSNVSIDFVGASRTTESGTSASTSLVASKDVDQIKCTCFAFHVTASYSQTTSFTLDIIPEPPSGPPQLTVNGETITNNQDVNITRRASIDVHCSVEGGYPNVSSVVIECAGVPSFFQNGTSAMTSFMASKVMDQSKCACTAEHISQAYDEATSFSISVFEPTTTTRFSFRSEMDSTKKQIEVVAGEDVGFVCEAHGMPAPDVTVRHVTSGFELKGKTSTSPTDEYTKTFQTTKTMACTDLGLYACVSNNGPVDREELTVLVTCPPHLSLNDTDTPPTSSETSRMGVSRSTFTVVSNPAVTSFKLGKYRRGDGGVNDDNDDDDDDEGNRKTKTTQPQLVKEFDSSQYRVNTEYAIPVNTVTLEFLDLDVDERFFYTLTLVNGLGPPLEVAFNSSFVRGAPPSKFGPDSLVGNYSNLFIVASVAVLVLVSLGVGMLMHLIKLPKATSVAKPDANRHQRNKPFSRPPMDARVWMTIGGHR